MPWYRYRFKFRYFLVSKNLSKIIKYSLDYSLRLRQTNQPTHNPTNQRTFMRAHREVTLPKDKKIIYFHNRLRMTKGGMQMKIFLSF